MPASRSGKRFVRGSDERRYAERRDKSSIHPRHGMYQFVGYRAALGDAKRGFSWPQTYN
jgi:hypothetical protein